MSQLKVYYQPTSDWAKIEWLLWGCLLLVSPIWASELFYSVNLPWAVYTGVILLCFLVRLFACFCIFSNQQLVIHQVFFWQKKVFNLSNGKTQLTIDGRFLNIDDGQKKPIRLFLSKKGSQRLKEIIHD